MTSVFLLLAGPGRISLDALMARRKTAAPISPGIARAAAVGKPAAVAVK
jgi:hypothetical protein